MSPIMNSAPPIIFDRRALRARKDRARHIFKDHDFLFREVNERLFDRIQDTPRAFKNIWILGANMQTPTALKKANVFISNISAAMLPNDGSLQILADEEAIPIKQGSMDLIVSNLALHWTNDLPGALKQICNALKPDGLFLASMFGGESLFELRKSLLDAEIEVTGGASPRISPFADVRDMGGLLQRAGFAMPVADLDTINVHYSSPLNLLKDLRGMGETNILQDRSRKPLRRSVILRAMEIYAERFSHPDGGVRATFQVIFLTGWAPSPDQPKALKPGSATVSLASILPQSKDSHKA